MIKLIDILNEADPKVGTGKKPKGSGRRLYTDENPKDTVGIKFKTAQDIKDTLSKASFKSKSHARQSQIINLIHQRVRAAYQNAKDPDVKRRLKTALDYAEQRKEASKEKTKRLRKLKEQLRKYIDWDTNYGKTFKIVYTPEGKQTSGEWKPGLISIVTPENGESWNQWKEIPTNELANWKKNWDKIQTSLNDYKYNQIIRSQNKK